LQTLRGLNGLAIVVNWGGGNRIQPFASMPEAGDAEQAELAANAEREKRKTDQAVEIPNATPPSSEPSKTIQPEPAVARKSIFSRLSRRSAPEPAPEPAPAPAPAPVQNTSLLDSRRRSLEQRIKTLEDSLYTKEDIDAADRESALGKGLLKRNVFARRQLEEARQQLADIFKVQHATEVKAKVAEVVKNTQVRQFIDAEQEPKISIPKPSLFRKPGFSATNAPAPAPAPVIKRRKIAIESDDEDEPQLKFGGPLPNSGVTRRNKPPLTSIPKGVRSTVSAANPSKIRSKENEKAGTFEYRKPSVPINLKDYNYDPKTGTYKKLKGGSRKRTLRTRRGVNKRKNVRGSRRRKNRPDSADPNTRRRSKIHARGDVFGF
jgi:hypothetical protein